MLHVFYEVVVCVKYDSLINIYTHMIYSDSI